MAHKLDDKGEFCIHCGGYKPGEAVTCVPHEDDPALLRPEPARRMYACEDFDAIGERFVELQMERAAAMNAAETPLIECALWY